MPAIRCPNCSHTWKTDRGVIVHQYSGSTDEQIRLAREALAAAEMEVPLPMIVLDADAPAWLAELAIQGNFGELVKRLGGTTDDA